MARIPSIKPQDMTSDQKQIYEEVIAKTGVLKGPARGYIYSPTLWETTNAVTNHYEECSLTRQQFRITALLTAQYWGAQYPFAAQATHSLQNGEDQSIIEAIRDRQRPTFNDPGDEAIYDLVTEQLENRKISDETFQQAVEKLGYESVVNALGLIGHFTKAGIMASALEIEVPEGSKLTLSS